MPEGSTASTGVGERPGSGGAKDGDADERACTGEQAVACARPELLVDATRHVSSRSQCARSYAVDDMLPYPMTKKWADIKQKRSPMPDSTRRLAEERAHVARQLALATARRQCGLRQEDVAERLGVHQSNVSRVEQAEDSLLSTLERYVNALGGHLEVRAVFDDQVVVLNSDLEPARPAAEATPSRAPR